MKTIRYDEADIRILGEMYQENFWYYGRYRFIFHAVMKYCLQGRTGLSILDIGAGPGTWAKFLYEKARKKIKEILIADPFLTKNSRKNYNIPKLIKVQRSSLNEIRGNKKWDIIFLLDVLEHIKNDKKAIAKSASHLKKNGYLIISAPAIMQFWSKNDEYAGHYRRYSKKDFLQISSGLPLVLIDCRYFMFYLSPLLWLARKLLFFRIISKRNLKKRIKKQYLKNMSWINKVCKIIFHLETPIGHVLSFPWGTSVLAVYKKQ